MQKFNIISKMSKAVLQIKKKEKKLKIRHAKYVKRFNVYVRSKSLRTTNLESILLAFLRFNVILSRISIELFH